MTRPHKSSVTNKYHAGQSRPAGSLTPQSCSTTNDTGLFDKLIQDRSQLSNSACNRGQSSSAACKFCCRAFFHLLRHPPTAFRRQMGQRTLQRMCRPPQNRRISHRQRSLNFSPPLGTFLLKNCHQFAQQLPIPIQRIQSLLPIDELSLTRNSEPLPLAELIAAGSSNALSSS